jgi:hypothetical protein
MTTETQEIQRRMAQVRRDLHQEAQEVVRGAQSMTDWKSLVKGHPWLSLGIAATVGYLIVPTRRSVTPTIVTLPASVPAVQTLAGAPASTSTKSKRTGWNVLGTAFSLVAPIAVRAAQNYAMNYLEQFLAAQTLTPPTVEPEMPGRGPGAAFSHDKGRRGPNGL